MTLAPSRFSLKAKVQAAGIVLLVVAALIWSSRVGRRNSPRGTAANGSSVVAYVGSAACESCHAAEVRAWRESQHAHAMAEATARTVSGRFDGRTFTYAGITSSFFKRDGRFYVRTDGANGRLADFEVKYTFGVSPLQQYLVAFPGGRLQALGIAWDTRPAVDGGQRWFHLYPGERIIAGDPLHWTGALQNWNFMCADCHSTNVRKGYNPAAHTYSTTWSEISVGCEACHGPGEAHAAWTRRGGTLKDPHADKGLTARLDERKGVAWGIDPATGLPHRSVPRTSDREIEVCARCHARRSQITDAIKAGDPFEDGFRASLLEPGLFYDDGQQRDEVYVYASFLQSRMYANGVTCSDCHDPHGGKLRLAGNTLCTQCHVATKYDVPSHHHHQAGSAGAACVECHMPSKTYMVVDPRRDHSLRIPRPDLAARLGVPDACTSACHRNRSAGWSSAQVVRWRGRSTPAAHFADVFQAAARGTPQSAADLRRLASDGTLPAIVRASAIDRLTSDGSSLEAGLASRLVADPSPLVRRAAVASLQGADTSARLPLLPSLLTDPVRSVRSQTVNSLVDLANAGLPESARPAFQRALDEHVAEQRFNADRPEAQTNIGTTMAALGRTTEAVAAFKEAIDLERTYVPAYINLADVYRSEGNDTAAERVLRDATAVVPSSADALHSLGLTLVRQHRISDALAALADAVRLAPDNARYAYVYGVALHDTGNIEKALAVLRASIARRPFDRDILYLLSAYSMEAGRTAEARDYGARLSAVDPTAEDVRSLLQQLQVPAPESRPKRPSAIMR